jgi:hemerythrin-like metal-binding protein
VAKLASSSSSTTRGSKRSPGSRLSDNNSILDLLFTHPDSSIALLDSELRLIRASDAYARVRDTAPEQLAGASHSELYAEDELGYFVRVLETGKPARITARPQGEAGGGAAETTYWDCTLTPVGSGKAGADGVLVTETDVTSRVRAERSLHQVAQILRAIDGAQENPLPQTTQQLLLDTLLAEAIQVTYSNYGFVGTVMPGQGEQVHLNIPTILNFSGGDGPLQATVSQTTEDLHHAGQDTLLGQVVGHGKPVIVNDRTDQHDALGLPGGHPPIDALLCMPFGEGRDTQWVLCVANGQEGYDDYLLDALRPLLNSYVRQTQAVAQTQEQETAMYALEQSRSLIRDLAIPAVEGEHDYLIDLINECYEEMEGNGDFAIIRNLLQQLDVGVAEHFRHEEQLMQSTTYPDFEAHRQSHERLLIKLRKHIDAYVEDPEHELETLKDTLTTWFGRHFSTYDNRLNQFFAEH